MSYQQFKKGAKNSRQGDSKKVLEKQKVRFLKLFLHTFCQKRTFCYPTTFIESLITHKPFIFEHSYVSYDKRQKSCTLIVILVILSYLTSPILNSSSKSNWIFLL